jgi:hypothetical protein
MSREDTLKRRKTQSTAEKMLVELLVTLFHTIQDRKNANKDHYKNK